LPALRKFLAFSLPVGLAAVLLAPGQAPPVRAASDGTALESPAELRLTALDTLMKGDKHSAVDLFEEAIRLATLQFGSDSTFLGDLYYEAGRLYLELDQFNQAEDYLRQAVKINPKNASARLALARLLDTRAKVQESIGQIREALMINPGSPVARYRFVQTLSKYGQSPSDKAIVTQESYTVAMMQKAARESVPKPSSSAENKPNKAGKNIAVPSLPKNLVPLKEEEDKAFSKGEGEGKQGQAGEGSATKSDTASPAEGVEKPASTSAFSLFPLKDMSQRKVQEQHDKEAKAQAQKKAEEDKKKTAESDIVQKLKEQLRQHEKERAAERAEREELARQAKAAKAEARAAKEQAKVESKPANKAVAKSAKPEANSNKAAAKPADKQTQAAAEQQPQQQQQQPVQQMVPQQMPMQPVFMPQMYPPPQVFTAPPKSKPGKGFVPPPPPTMPMYPGMMQPVVQQVIPAQQAKPAPKPKVEKPKPVEVKPVEDKPPPMATPGEDDPNFLLDWGELKKDKIKKKGK